MSEKPHRKLIAWQKAMDLVEAIYQLTETFPDEERYGLVTQLRRASVSVVSNIAEGAARQTVKERIQFLYTARGSVSELDTQLEIAHRLRFTSTEQASQVAGRLDEVGKLLSGLIASKKVAVVSSSPTHYSQLTTH